MKVNGLRPKKKKISVFLQCKSIFNKTNIYTTNNNFFSYWKYISIYTYPIYIMFHVFSLFTHIDRAKDRYRRFYANELIKMHKMSIFYTEKSQIILLCLVFFHSSLWNTSTKQGRCKNISYSILNKKCIIFTRIL